MTQFMKKVGKEICELNVTFEMIKRLTTLLRMKPDERNKMGVTLRHRFNELIKKFYGQNVVKLHRRRCAKFLTADTKIENGKATLRDFMFIDEDMEQVVSEILMNFIIENEETIEWNTVQISFDVKLILDNLILENDSEFLMLKPKIAYWYTYRLWVLLSINGLDFCVDQDFIDSKKKTLITLFSQHHQLQPSFMDWMVSTGVLEEAKRELEILPVVMVDIICQYWNSIPSADQFRQELLKFGG